MPQRKRDFISTALAAASGIFFLLFALIQQRAVFSRLFESLKYAVYYRIEHSLLALALICWTANILLPASKSKMVKSALLFMSTVYFLVLCATPFLFWWDYSIGAFFSVAFLLADRIESNRLEPVVIGFVAIFALMVACGMVSYFF